MSRQHPRWLCPTLNTLVINNFANVYGKNEWDFYFRNPERTGAELRLFYSIRADAMFKVGCFLFENQRAVISAAQKTHGEKNGSSGPSMGASMHVFPVRPKRRSPDNENRVK